MDDLKIGDIVKVWHRDNSNFTLQIFVKYGCNNTIIFVDLEDKEKFKKGEAFNTHRWTSNYEKFNPKYIPFTFEDAKDLIGKGIIHKDSNYYTLLTYISEDVVIISDCNSSFKDLLENFTFINGSPCGKLKS